MRRNTGTITLHAADVSYRKIQRSCATRIYQQRKSARYDTVNV